MKRGFNRVSILKLMAIAAVTSLTCGASASAVAGEAKVCGGGTKAQCAPGDYCQMSAKQCQAADGSGVCRPAPQLCPHLYMPVCGCDEKTYPNACSANAAGVSVLSKGSCKSAGAERH